MLWLQHLMCVQVKAVVLDPTNHFNVDRTLTKQDVQKLIEVNAEFVFTKAFKTASFTLHLHFVI